MTKAYKKFMIVVCEYFTKWVEVEVITTITQKSIKKFLWKNIVCRFGILNWIIIDNGPSKKEKRLPNYVATYILP